MKKIRVLLSVFVGLWCIFDFNAVFAKPCSTNVCPELCLEKFGESEDFSKRPPVLWHFLTQGVMRSACRCYPKEAKFTSSMRGEAVWILDKDCTKLMAIFYRPLKQ